MSNEKSRDIGKALSITTPFGIGLIVGLYDDAIPSSSKYTILATPMAMVGAYTSISASLIKTGVNIIIGGRGLEHELGAFPEDSLAAVVNDPHYVGKETMRALPKPAGLTLAGYVTGLALKRII